MIGPSIKAADLRDRVRVEKRRTVDDGYGNLTGRWVIHASGVPARIVPAKGGEQVRADRLASLANYEIYVRQTTETSEITNGFRLVNERTGEAYDIKWAGNLDERGRFLTLTCQAGDTEG